MATRRVSYAWTDLPFMVVALVLLIPILMQLGQIVLNFIEN